MKRMKKIVSMLLAVVMVLGMSVTAFADGPSDKSITIKSSSTVDVTDGRDFTAYKILDAKTVEGATDKVVYTVPSYMDNFYTNRYSEVKKEDANYAYEVAQKIAAETDMYAFAEAAIAYVIKNNVPGTKGVVVKNDYVISGLDVGYYVINDGFADEDGGKKGETYSQVMLDSTVNNLEIVVKADAPKVDKKITGAEDTDPDTSSYTNRNNASVGDKVPYTVTSKVPAMSGYKFYRFVISDTLSEGLTLDVKKKGEGQDAVEDLNGSFSIKIGTLATEVNATTNETVYKVDPNTNKYVFENEDEVLELQGIEATSFDENAGPAYYVNKNGQNFEIVFTNFIKLAPKYVGQDIVIEYSATVNENAVIGVNPNTNTVSLKYSNDPNGEGDGTPDNPDENPYEFSTNEPSGESEEITVRTFVIALELVKVNEAMQNLAGAQFTIEGTRINKVFASGIQFVEDANGKYWKYDNTYTTENPAEYDAKKKELESKRDALEAEENKSEDYDKQLQEVNDAIQRVDDVLAKYENPRNTYSKKVIVPSEDNKELWVEGEVVNGSETKVTKTLEVDANGVLVFRGLGAGTYTITEIKAPDGYNMLETPIKVVIDCKYDAEGTTPTWTARWAQYGKATNGGYEEPKENDYGEITFDGSNQLLVGMNVQNLTGSLLPSTGGIGTTIFYVVGAILVIGAGILLVAKKRMSNR